MSFFGSLAPPQKDLIPPLLPLWASPMQREGYPWPVGQARLELPPLPGLTLIWGLAGPAQVPEVRLGLSAHRCPELN